MADEHGCRRTRNAGHAMVLGEPKAPVTPTLGVARQIKRVAKGVGRVAAKRDGR